MLHQFKHILDLSSLMAPFYEKGVNRVGRASQYVRNACLW